MILMRQKKLKYNFHCVVSKMIKDLPDIIIKPLNIYELGFRKSCKIGLLEVTGDIIKALDEQECLVLDFIDTFWAYVIVSRSQINQHFLLN